jgi:hypothetical protein
VHPRTDSNMTMVMVKLEADEEGGAKRAATVRAERMEKSSTCMVCCRARDVKKGGLFPVMWRITYSPFELISS